MQETKYIRENRSIHISKKHIDFFNELLKEAQSKKIGIGEHMICELKKYRNMQKKESKV